MKKYIIAFSLLAIGIFAFFYCYTAPVHERNLEDSTLVIILDPMFHQKGEAYRRRIIYAGKASKHASLVRKLFCALPVIPFVKDTLPEGLYFIYLLDKNKKLAAYYIINGKYDFADESGRYFPARSEPRFGMPAGKSFRTGRQTLVTQGLA